VDDVNSMDESMDTGEQLPGGISRRDMIKASVVAGALVWSAPLLLSGTASAQTGCCPSPFQEVALKFPGEGTVEDPADPNCGVSCLDHLVDENVDCCKALADALITGAVIDKGATGGQNPHPGSAIISVDPALATITGASVRTPDCFNAVATPPGCATPIEPTGRVVVSGSQVIVQLQTVNGTHETINQVEVLLCVRASITLFC
jgi:hypothetical protein